MSVSAVRPNSVLPAVLEVVGPVTALKTQRTEHSPGVGGGPPARGRGGE